MSILKDFLNGLIAKGKISNSSDPMSEEELLKAIEDLPVEEPVSEEHASEEVITTTPWCEGASWIKVPKIKCWSEFKYIGKPEFRGLPEIDTDERIYFTIPCGFEWDQTIKFWFLTFPASCDDKEIKDFFTVVNPMEA